MKDIWVLEEADNVAFESLDHARESVKITWSTCTEVDIRELSSEGGDYIEFRVTGRRRDGELFQNNTYFRKYQLHNRPSHL